MAEREPYVTRDAFEEEDDARDARFAHLLRRGRSKRFILETDMFFPRVETILSPDEVAQSCRLSMLRSTGNVIVDASTRRCQFVELQPVAMLGSVAGPGLPTQVPNLSLCSLLRLSCSRVHPVSP